MPHRSNLNFVIRIVNCSSAEARLRNCAYLNQSHCNSGNDAGVICRAFKNVNTTINVSSDTMRSVLVTWEYHRHNGTSRQLTSFKVECSSELHGHYTRFSVSNSTFRINVGGLFPFASYNCCISAIYYGHYLGPYLIPNYGYYTAESRCTLLEAMTNAVSTEMVKPLSSVDSNMRANIISGVLGFIITILVLLLAICGGALLYLLRSRISGVVHRR